MIDIQDYKWDSLLNIHTSGRDDTKSDQYRYPYEPTPYKVLERLANSGYITKWNTLIDYGCGKGRVGFFISYQVGCSCVGIEYDERIYDAAIRNKNRAISGEKVVMYQARAESFKLPEEVDRCFFFNPFSLEILKKVLSRILESWYECPREILLFFYYPQNEYISYLMTVDELIFADEIDCKDLFGGKDVREQIVVFEIGSVIWEVLSI